MSDARFLGGRGEKHGMFDTATSALPHLAIQRKGERLMSSLQVGAPLAPIFWALNIKAEPRWLFWVVVQTTSLPPDTHLKELRDSW